MALPAALKRKLTIAPIRPGRAEAAFAPRVLSPFPKSVPSFFKALVIAPRTVPIVMPAARKMAVTVTPYFLKIAFTFSRKRSRRESPSASIFLSLSISFSSLLISSISFSAFSFSEIGALSSFMTFLVLVFLVVVVLLFLAFFLRFFEKPPKVLIAPHHRVCIHGLLIDPIVFADLFGLKFAFAPFHGPYSSLLHLLMCLQFAFF